MEWQRLQVGEAVCAPMYLHKSMDALRRNERGCGNNYTHVWTAGRTVIQEHTYRRLMLRIGSAMAEGPSSENVTIEMLKSSDSYPALSNFVKELLHRDEIFGPIDGNEVLEEKVTQRDVDYFKKKDRVELSYIFLHFGKGAPMNLKTILIKDASAQMV